MYENTGVCHKAASGNIITPKGKLNFAQYLVTPDKGKHNLMICFKPDADLKLLKNEMGAKAMEGLEGDSKQAKNFVEKRFNDPNNRSGGGKPLGEEFEGWTLITASSQNAPDFCYPNGQKIPADKIKDECYSGRWARVTLNPYWLDNKVKDKETGKEVKVRGIFLGLVNVQLLDHDTPIGFVKPSGDSEFGAVEVTGTAPANTASDDDVGSLFD